MPPFLTESSSGLVPSLRTSTVQSRALRRHISSRSGEKDGRLTILKTLDVCRAVLQLLLAVEQRCERVCLLQCHNLVLLQPVVSPRRRGQRGTTTTHLCLLLESVLGPNCSICLLLKLHTAWSALSYPLLVSAYSSDVLAVRNGQLLELTAETNGRVLLVCERRIEVQVLPLERRDLSLCLCPVPHGPERPTRVCCDGC